MEYRVIDRNNWQRKEYFEHYLKEVPCTYSIPFSVQVHHAVCDGYHASCFINDLQDAIHSTGHINLNK